MSNDIKVLADYPAVIIFDGQVANLHLSTDKGYCRISEADIRVRGFSKKYPDMYLNSFTVGHDEKHGYWAHGNGATLSAHDRGKKIAFGFDIGDNIKIENQLFKIERAPNNNIKLVRV